MALTPGTTSPIVPASNYGSGQSGLLLSFPRAATTAVRKGDIMVLASGLATVDVDAQADGAILGVAVEAVAGDATVDFEDQVLLAAALPGALFYGSMITAAATNYTANAAADITATTHDTILGTDAYAAFLHIDEADVAGGGQLRLLTFAKEQMRGLNFTAFGNTVIVNPRVLFCFRTSAFQPLI